MRRIFGGAAAALMLAATMVVGASPAHADTVTIDYEVTAEDPMTHAWPEATCWAVEWQGAARHAVIAEATVTISGDYTFSDTYPAGSVDDGEILLFDGEFDAPDVSNCLAYIPGNATLTLTAGQTYAVVLSAETGDGIGTYSFTASGPGVFQVDFGDTAPEDPPAPDPTPPSHVATARK